MVPGLIRHDTLLGPFEAIVAAADQCGLAIVAGPLGMRHLEAAEAVAASLAEPFSPHVYVTLHEDGTVTLTGMLGSKLAVDKAVAAAESIKGVKKVDHSGLKSSH